MLCNAGIHTLRKPFFQTYCYLLHMQFTRMLTEHSPTRKESSTVLPITCFLWFSETIFGTTILFLLPPHWIKSGLYHSPTPPAIWPDTLQTTKCYQLFQRALCFSGWGVYTTFFLKSLGLSIIFFKNQLFLWK